MTASPIVDRWCREIGIDRCQAPKIVRIAGDVRQGRRDDEGRRRKL